jgi:heme/copper-type cytochrome/quinol oxidase subunit 3
MSTVAISAPVSVASRRPLERHSILLPDAILGTAVFVVTEVMFFTSLLSAFIVTRASAGTLFALSVDVRLPIMTTAFNTAVLLGSGVALWRAGVAFAAGRKDQARTTYLAAVLMGAFFVSVQGYEWMRLLTAGMTLKAGVFASLFYLLIGSHALHAVSAIVALLWFLPRLWQDRLTLPQLRGLQIYWSFIVGVWPILFAVVYF